MSNTAHLYDPKTRDARYKGNFAQYLVDLHDAKGTFNFCGGMMFQLVLSETLRDRLAKKALTVDVTAENKNEQTSGVTVHDARYRRMQMTPGYERSNTADNVRYFHGREVRNVGGAAGGHTMVLHLSDSHESDPEGWSQRERQDYNGWAHDGKRPWRKLSQWEAEGVIGFRAAFGDAAYGLHHRFYLHLDAQNNLWLSAEDGCEGYAMRK